MPAGTGAARTAAHSMPGADVHDRCRGPPSPHVSPHRAPPRRGDVHDGVRSYAKESHVRIDATAKSVAIPGHPLQLDADISASGWLAVFLTFLLARVFADGTRMREYLAGTVYHNRAGSGRGRHTTTARGGPHLPRWHREHRQWQLPGRADAVAGVEQAARHLDARRHRRPPAPAARPTRSALPRAQLRRRRSQPEVMGAARQDPRRPAVERLRGPSVAN